MAGSLLLIMGRYRNLSQIGRLVVTSVRCPQNRVNCIPPFRALQRSAAKSQWQNALRVALEAEFAPAFQSLCDIRR